MTENLRAILRCTGVALAVIAALVLVPAAAEAQHRTGLAVSKDCPIDPIDQGDTATCSFIISNLDTQHGVENVSVTNRFPWPSGPVTAGVCLRDGLPVTTLGVAGTATDSCSGSFEEVAPFSCSERSGVLADQVRGAGQDCGATCGVADPGDRFEGLRVTGSTTNVIRVNPITCPADTDCVNNACVVGVGCQTTNVADSTPCGTDTDGNTCTSPGCFGGVCVQNHILVAASTPCGTDTNPTDCTTPGCTAAGVCSQTHNLVAASTPCGTDTDGLTCTIPGCDAAGRCSQTHIDDCQQAGCGVLVIDEDSIDNGLPPNFFSAQDVNDQLADEGLRTELKFFNENPGREITLWTGTVGDEGWFALETIPTTWSNAGPTNDGLRNFLLAGPGLGSGSDPEKFLDKIPDVTPLRATGLKMLEDSNACICAVVYDSDISINYDPLNGSLKGANLGIVAFEVLDVRRLTGQSSGSLPEVDIRILDADEVCAGPLTLFDAPAPISSSLPFDVDPDP